MTLQIPHLSAQNPGAQRFLARSPLKMLIGNDWVNAASGHLMDALDPATGSLLTRFPQAAEADVDRAVAAARLAFDSCAWRGLLPAARAKILWRIGNLIDIHTDELAELAVHGSRSHV
jgi:phenylacetaldehyde dehydrogenase